MAQQTINIGSSANDGTGDAIRSAFDKSNDNFTELYAGSGVADNSVTHDKLENRYTVLSALGTGTDQTLDFSAATTFTATMNGNATFTITNPKQGQVVDLILSGNHTPTLAMSGAAFNKVGGVDYDGSATNLIQILVADDSASEVFYYSVATIASDTTP